MSHQNVQSLIHNNLQDFSKATMKNYKINKKNVLCCRTKMDKFHIMILSKVM